MKNAVFFIWILIFSSTNIHSQCTEYLGYDKQGTLASIKSLKGYLSNQDTAMKMFLTASIAKTETTNGVTLVGIFSKVGTIDNSTKVKLTFQDNTYIYITDYLSSLNNADPKQKSNNIGFFSSLITDKYHLLLIKTKPIVKVQITGSNLDASTYLINGSTSIDFLLGMDCLQQYL